MHPAGAGLLGERRLDGAPGQRDEVALFALTRAWAANDPVFRHIHDVDERFLP